MAWETLVYLKMHPAFIMAPEKKRRILILSSFLKITLTLVVCIFLSLGHRVIDFRSEWLSVLKTNDVTEWGCGDMYLLALFVHAFSASTVCESPINLPRSKRSSCTQAVPETTVIFTPASDQELPFHPCSKTASLWLPEGLRLSQSGSVMAYLWGFWKMLKE